MPDPAAVRAQLAAKLADTRRRHAKLDAHLHNADRDVPQDWQDRAQMINNDEVLEALEDNARDAIAALESAIERIDAGTWDTCTACGEPIGERRLEVLPTTPLCVQCAAEAG